MIITRNWLGEWMDLSKIDIDTLLSALNSIGLEVGSCEKISLPKKVVIGHVKAKESHPNADKLNICEVDIGDEVLQIVCGAKNVGIGQYVPVSLIGAVLPNGLEIKESELRGVKSQGMICSTSELGLPKINDGIWVLDDSLGKLELGKELANYESLNDYIIEIDLTPNRGDCLSVKGVARDLCAYFSQNLNETLPFKNEDEVNGIAKFLVVYADKNVNCSLAYKLLHLENPLENSSLLSLRLGIIKEYSKDALENFLKYASHSTGVILRAYAFDKVAKNDAKVVLNVKVGEFGEYNVYANDEIIGVVGARQNEEFKANEKDKEIIVEASFIKPNLISSLIGEHKDKIEVDELFYKTSRGSDPDLNNGGEFLFSIIKAKNPSAKCFAGSQKIISKDEKIIISFTVEEITSLIGKNIPKNDMLSLLKRLQFDINAELDLINATVPNFRHDILNSHDICEEIVRIMGIENIASQALNFSEKNRLNFNYKNYFNGRQLRLKASQNSFYEAIHYIFDSKSQSQALGFSACKAELLNPINQELDSLRVTFLNHFIKSVQRNMRNGRKAIKLFEFGKIFDVEGKELSKIGFIASGLKDEASLLNGRKPSAMDFLTFASLVQNVVSNFSLELPEHPLPFLSKFEQAKIYQNGKEIGFIGRLNLKIEAQEELGRTYYCEIDFDALTFAQSSVQAYSKFQASTRDLSLVLPKDFNFNKLKEMINSLNIENLKSYEIIDFYSDETLKDDMSLTLRFTIQDMNKTLSEEEITSTMDEILASLKDKFGITIR